MNNNQDVLKELEVKNKEIYLNKLNIDLDNNEEILLITLENIINHFNEEMTNKINEIQNTIEIDNITKFNNVLKSTINDLIKTRTIKFKKDIINIDNIDYKETINQYTITILSEIKKCYFDNIDLLIKNTTNKDNTRLIEYLNNINYEKITNKIKECFNNTNTILYNNYLESLEKFNNLNKKTLK